MEDLLTIEQQSQEIVKLNLAMLAGSILNIGIHFNMTHIPVNLAQKITTMNCIRCIFLVLSILQISCRGYQKELSKKEAYYEVDVDTLEDRGVGLISSYFKSVKPIILETSENNLLKSIDAIQVTSDCIFILDRGYKKLHCFDKAGRFIRQIGHLGNGPGEFNNISDFTLDENNKLIFILDNYTSKIHVYKFTGEHIFSINIHNTMDGVFGHIQYSNNHLFTDYQPNKISTKGAAPLLMKIDINSGKLLDEYLSSEIYNLGFQLITFKNNSYFYSKNSHSPYYAPIYSNIVFSIENNITPYFQIKSSRLLKKDDLETFDLSFSGIIADINNLNKIKSIWNFLEIGDYIICEYSDWYKLNTIVFSKTNKSANLYGGFFDDYVYKVFEGSIPHYMACSDTKGMYAHMNINDIPLFIDYYNSGKIKFDFNQFQIDITEDLSEDSNPLLFYYELRE
ncbi:MAG TPA: hypothetical protein DIV40_06250 [Clostridiales bacterium]|nr:hypothetical protein [Clostridiales bacterium]